MEHHLLFKHGIYRIRNIVNNKCYIGSAAGKGLRNRWNLHYKQLNQDTHHSIVLQRAWNKYGADVFVFEVLLYCDPENCLMYEQIALDHYEPEYNISPTAGSNLGTKRPPMKTITRHKIKDGLERYFETHRGIQHPLYGRKLSLETRQKISSAHRGRDPNPKAIEAMRQANLGKAHNAKLQEDDIRAIRKLLHNGISLKDIALQFDVARRTISDIKRGVSWKHVK